MHGLWFFRDIQQLRNFILHFERQLVRLDDAVQLVRSTRCRPEFPIHGLNEINLTPLQCGCRLSFQVRKITAVIDLRSLIVSRKKGTPVVHGTAKIRRWINRDITRQVLIFRPKSIHQPCPHRRSRQLGLSSARVQLNHRLGMGRSIRVQATQKAELIDVLSDIRIEF